MPKVLIYRGHRRARVRNAIGAAEMDAPRRADLIAMDAAASPAGAGGAGFAHVCVHACAHRAH